MNYREVEFQYVNIGDIFRFSVMPGVSEEDRFMKVLDLLEDDTGEMNAVWLTRHRGCLCNFEDNVLVKVEVL